MTQYGRWTGLGILTVVVVWLAIETVPLRLRAVQVAAPPDSVISEQPAELSERKRRLKGGLEMSAPDRFAGFHRAIRTAAGETAPAYPPNYRVEALEKARKSMAPAKMQQAMVWQERGPANVAGRARAVLADPDDASRQTWYVGSASGGVWKTEDAGNTWQELTRDLPNLATTTLAMPASNPNVIYAGTGEGYGSFAFVYGQGIWKTENKGLTWSQLPGTAGDRRFTNVLRLIVDPDDENTLVAATSTGGRSNFVEESYLMRSTDGGKTWLPAYTSYNRFEQVIADPQDFLVQYATMHGRGLVKSVDGGKSWTEIFDPFFEVGRLEMAIAPSDTRRLYVAAENGFTDATLFMSKDAGESWEVVDNTVGVDPLNWLGELGWYSNSLAVDPGNPDRVFVGGIDIYQFDLAETTYEQGFVRFVIENDPARFLEVHQVVYAPVVAEKLGGNPVVSTADFIEVEVRFGPDQKQKAHRFEGKWLALYKDFVDVEVEAWDVKNNRRLTLAFEDLDLDNRWDMGGGLSEFSERLFIIDEDYSNSVPHAPTIEDPFNRALYVLLVKHEMDEGIDNGPFPEAQLTIVPEFRTYRDSQIEPVTDGYGGSHAVSKGVHVDHHQLLFVPSSNPAEPPMLLDANDGGVAVSYDMGATFQQTGDTFSQLFAGAGSARRPMRGLNTTQFFGVDKMNGADRYVGGTQDNGSWISPDLSSDNAAPWMLTRDGDGFEAIWHYDNPDLIIQTSQFNRIYRSSDGGHSWQNVSPTFPSVFLTRLAKTNQAPDLLFMATAKGIARSTDFGANWEETVLVPIWPEGTSPVARLSLASPDVVWVAATMGGSAPVFVSQDGGDTYAEMPAAATPALGAITNIATHPAEPETAYALFSIANQPKVLRTTDLGQTWEELSGFGDAPESSNGFPDVAVYSLLVMPHDNDVLWVGTEIGIVASVDGGATWGLLDADLPAVAVWQMRVVNDQIVIATHGRGIWSVTIPELAAYAPAGQAPTLLAVEGGLDGRFMLDLELMADYDSTRVVANGQVIARPAADTSGRIQVVADLTGEDGEIVQFAVEGFQDGEKLVSNSRQGTLHRLNETIDLYIADFEDTPGDFILDGFDIRAEAGFSGTGLHSAHPYPAFYEATAVLRTPVRVNDENPMVYFDEVVRVEAGEAGATFNEAAFYDYVVVEGSSDGGLTWRSLEAGYDVRREPAWAAVDLLEPATEAQMVQHTLRLQPTFEHGEEVLLRFRMQADNAGSGWGWAIDNLVVQGAIPTSRETPALPEEYALLQNYPNPFNRQTTISYHLPEPGPVNLAIYDVAGRKIQQLTATTEQPAGSYRVTWDGTTLRGMPAASGIYFCQLEAGPGFRKTMKLVKVD